MLQNLEKSRRKIDLKARAAKLIVGDRVLVKILAHDGKHKLSDKWSDEIYVVTEQTNSDIPVYKVKREDGEGIQKTLHRNHLLHLGNALQDETNDPVKPIPKPRKQAPTPMPRLKRKVLSEETVKKTNSDSEDEDSSFVITTTTKHNQYDSIDYDAATSDEETVLEGGIIEERGTAVDVDPMVSGDAQVPDQQLNILEGDDSGDTEADTSDVRPEETDASSILYRAGGSTSVCRADRDGQTQNEPPPVMVPRRSARVRHKPAWQESGDFCMSIINKSLMLQSLLSSDVMSDMDPSIIAAIVKGIGETL